MFSNCNTFFWCYIFLLIYLVDANPPLLIQNGTRYQQIYLPNRNETWNKEINTYFTYVSPFSNIRDYSSSKELCSSIEKELFLYEKSLWNNTVILDPCNRYFCTRNQSYNNTYLHYGAQRYCTQCSLTKNQNFTAHENCTIFDKKICKDCTSESICIYYDYDFPLCYRPKDNKFYRRDDFVHLVMILMFYEGFPIMNIIIGLIYFIFYLFLLIIPNIYKSIRDVRGKNLLTFSEKFRIIFSLPNQTILIFTICSITLSIGGLVDAIITQSLYDVAAANALGFVLLINGAITIIGIICLIIHWFYLIGLMDSAGGGEQNRFSRYFILYVISLLIFIFIIFWIGLSYILYLYVDKARRVVWIYVLGGISILMFIICSILIIILFILSIKMLYVLSQTQSSNTNLFELAVKLKVNLRNI